MFGGRHRFVTYRPFALFVKEIPGPAAMALMVPLSSSCTCPASGTMIPICDWYAAEAILKVEPVNRRWYVTESADWRLVVLIITDCQSSLLNREIPDPAAMSWKIFSL